MFAIIGATGQTGSAVAQALLAQGLPVRVVVRKPESAAQWQSRGAEAALADVQDADALAQAFHGCTAAYLMNPPALMDADMFATARKTLTAQVSAAKQAGIAKVVGLSSVGGHHPAGTGNILTNHLLETSLQDYPGAVTLLRASYFLENWGSVLPAAKEQGVLPSMLLPLARAIEMQAASDVGAAAATLLTESWEGHRIVESHGPAPVSPNDVAAALSGILGRPVQAVPMAREQWEGIFGSFGFPPVTVGGFCEMIDGVNSGHVDFDGGHRVIRGKTTLEAALRALLAH
ncbi:MAG: NAD(P)H-binding protein [Bryobacteraceae bacterium]|nr:NAD(P)H-binding protein [Bryobacteraceae bacterium]